MKAKETMHHPQRMFSLVSIIYFIVTLTAGAPRSTSAQNVSSEISLLLQIKSVLGNSDGDALSSWSSSNPLCAWRNIQWMYTNGTLLGCSSASVAKNASLSADPSIAAYAISLSDAGLNGSLPTQLSQLSSLHTLNLSSNSLAGGIPLDLGTMASLQKLSLGENQLSGAIPASIWNLCGHLQELQLDHNTFSSSIPSPAASLATGNTCPLLQKLDLDDNLLSGSIPSFFGSFASLTELNLSNNNLSGAIPETLSQLSKLTSIDLANNNLSGQVPAVNGATVASYSGNELLCGAPLTTPCPGAQGVSKKGLDKRVVAGLVIGAMAVAVVALAVCVGLGHRHNWGRDMLIKGDMAMEADDDIGDGKLVRFEGGEHLTVEEVLNAPGEVLGKTSYGTVYKAKLGSNTGGAMIALRLLREDTVKDKDLFTPAIHQLGQIRYPNVVSLLAYYAGPKGEKLLVYNYLSRGSLADLLYNRSVNRSSLTWAQRHKIALGAARGLVHLHHGGMRNPIIHGNLKSKNIMVDESFDGHLADYGLPLLMNVGAQNEMLSASAAQGYKAPEIAKMSRANKATDIYNFGIVLLEILTGKKPRESGDGGNKQAVDLPTMVKAAVLEERISDLFDLDIVTGLRSPVEDGLVQTLQLAMGCCAPSSVVRPDIKEVVRQLEEIRPKIPTPLYTPTGMKSPRDFS